MRSIVCFGRARVDPRPAYRCGHAPRGFCRLTHSTAALCRQRGSGIVYACARRSTSSPSTRRISVRSDSVGVSAPSIELPHTTLGRLSPKLKTEIRPAQPVTKRANGLAVGTTPSRRMRHAPQELARSSGRLPRWPQRQDPPRSAAERTPAQVLFDCDRLTERLDRGQDALDVEAHHRREAAGAQVGSSPQR